MVRTSAAIVTLRPGRTWGFIRFLLAAGLVVTGIFGCTNEFGAARSPSQPVKGLVVLDGKPLSSGVVVLVSSKDSGEYFGNIGSDGRFTIKTGEDQGAPEGDYRVRIDPELKPKQTTRTKKVAANLPYPGRYADETTSDLSFTVKPGENDLDLKLTKSPATSKQERGGSSKD